MVTNFILCFWEKNGLKVIYASEGICLFNTGTAVLIWSLVKQRHPHKILQ